MGQSPPCTRGLPTRLIEQRLPCLGFPRQPIVLEGVTPETMAILARERDRMSERICTSTRNRAAILTYLTDLAVHQESRSLESSTT